MFWKPERLLQRDAGPERPGSGVLGATAIMSKRWSTHMSLERE